jgi:hypothetical protein
MALVDPERLLIVPCSSQEVENRKPATDKVAGLREPTC